MEALARTLAHEERQHGIHVNVVAPGLVETEMGVRLARAFTGNRELVDLRSLDAAAPFGRVCQPADVAEVVLWLCTDGAGYVTGQRIEVDGGGTPADAGGLVTPSSPRASESVQNGRRACRCTNPDRTPRRADGWHASRTERLGAPTGVHGRTERLRAASHAGEGEPGGGDGRVADLVELAGPRAVAVPQPQQDRLGRSAQRGIALGVLAHDAQPVAVALDEPFAGDVGAVHVEAAGRELEVLAHTESRHDELEVLVDPVARQLRIDRRRRADRGLGIPAVDDGLVRLAPRPDTSDLGDRERMPRRPVEVDRGERVDRVRRRPPGATAPSRCRDPGEASTSGGAASSTARRAQRCTPPMMSRETGEIPPRTGRDRGIEGTSFECRGEPVDVGPDVVEVRLGDHDERR